MKNEKNTGQRDPLNINFYHAEFRPRRISFSARRMAWGLVFALAALLGWYGYTAWQIQQAEQNIAALKSETERRDQELAGVKGQGKSEAIVAALKQEAEALEKKRARLGEIETIIRSGQIGRERGFSGHLQAFSHAIVPGTWLVRIDLGAHGEIERLVGRALDDDGPARFLDALRHEPQFKGMKFSALKIERGKTNEESGKEDPHYVTFTLSAKAEGADEKNKQENKQEKTATGVEEPCSGEQCGQGLIDNIPMLRSLIKP